MEISPEGRVINYQISQSIIKTTERMTYDAVNQMIAGDEAALENYAKIADSVKIMVELHHILEAMRKRRVATVSFASSMNDSIIRSAMPRVRFLISIGSPFSLTMIFASTVSKSMAPRLLRMASNTTSLKILH